MDGLITYRVDQMMIVERERVKPLLPEMTAPALALIDGFSVPPMRFRQCPAQTIGLRRHHDEMDMIWHQTICQNRNSSRVTAFCDPSSVGEIITFAKESWQTSTATLRNVMGNLWDDDARHTGHDNELIRPEMERQEQKKNVPAGDSLPISSTATMYHHTYAL